jgi:hypothetical protein
LHDSDNEGIKDGIKELVFIAEIVVDQCLTAPGEFSDAVNTCPSYAMLGKFVCRCVEQSCFFVLFIS